MVQKLLKKRKDTKFGRGPKSKYLLSGYIQCQNCGYSITGHTVYGGRDKSPRIIYRCKTQKAEKCLIKPVNSVYLERYVAEKITWFLKLMNAGIITKLINDELNVLNKTIEKEIKELKSKIVGIKNELNFVNKRITSVSNGVDRLLTEQANDLYSMLEIINNDMKILVEDHSNIRKAAVDETKKKQRIIRSNKQFTMRELVSIMVVKIILGNDEILFKFKLNKLIDIEISRDIEYFVKVNRDWIANNQF